MVAVVIGVDPHKRSNTALVLDPHENGFRNFDNYRLRLLLSVGLDWRTVHWQAPPATPIRGRSPRLVA